MVFDAMLAGDLTRRCHGSLRQADHSLVFVVVVVVVVAAAATAPDEACEGRSAAAPEEKGGKGR